MARLMAAIVGVLMSVSSIAGAEQPAADFTKDAGMDPAQMVIDIGALNQDLLDRIKKNPEAATCIKPYQQQVKAQHGNAMRAKNDFDKCGKDECRSSKAEAVNGAYVSAWEWYVKADECGAEKGKYSTMDPIKAGQAVPLVKRPPTLSPPTPDTRPGTRE